MPFVMLLGGIGFMVGTGGTALVSKVLGEGNREKANRYFSMMVFLTLLLGVLLTAVGIAAMEPVARFLGATDAMIADSVLYGRIVVGFTTAFMLQNVFQSFLIAAEKPKLGLLATNCGGADQHPAGRAVRRRLRLGRRGRGDCNRHQPVRRRPAAAVLFPASERQPAAAGADKARACAAGESLHERLLRADEQHFVLGREHGVQLPAFEIHRRGRGSRPTAC